MGETDKRFFPFFMIIYDHFPVFFSACLIINLYL